MTYTPPKLSSDELLDILMLSPNPMAVYSTEDIVIQLANDAMIALWGKNRSVIGQTLEDAVPELKGQPFIGILQNVWRTGVTYTATEAAASLRVNGKIDTYYFDFEYKALRTEDGSIYCILHTAKETSERMRQERERTDQSEKINSLNSSLAYSNQSLTSGNEMLRDANALLSISENRLAAIAASPDVFVVVTNEKGGVLFANEAFRRLTGRSLNGLAQQGYTDLLHPNDRVAFTIASNQMTNGETPSIINYRLQNREGKYHHLKAFLSPVFDAQDVFAGSISCAIDTTEETEFEAQLQNYNEELQAANEELRNSYEEIQTINEELQTTNEELQNAQDDLVVTNQRLFEEEEKVRLAIKSANFGTWYINTRTREFIPSPRMKEMFGYHPDEVMPYEAALHQIREDHRQAVIDAVEKAITSTGVYYSEYPITGFHDGKLRWVRASGRVHTTPAGEAVSFFGLMEDITERREDEQRKNDFISMVSHELKTPLTVLTSYLQIMQMSVPNGTGIIADMISKSSAQVKKMTSLINGFLNMSRIDAGKIHLDKQMFSVQDLVVQLCGEYAMAHPKYAFHHADCEVLQVNGDKDKIGTVISNFLSNAVKYSPAGSPVSVRCGPNGPSGIKISVTDKGKGLAVADQEKVFDRFYRVQTADIQAVAGFGIGLYLCAEIIAAHKGQIGVESAEGKGSTFWFTLPME